LFREVWRRYVALELAANADQVRQAALQAGLVAA
jgi:hypothetical protein